jgi:hypothetical protein
MSRCLDIEEFTVTYCNQVLQICRALKMYNAQHKIDCLYQLHLRVVKSRCYTRGPRDGENRVQALQIVCKKGHFRKWHEARLKYYLNCRYRPNFQRNLQFSSWGQRIIDDGGSKLYLRRHLTCYRACWRCYMASASVAWLVGCRQWPG